MNRIETTMSKLNILIKSAISRPEKIFPLQITTDYTIFQIKKEIEKIDKASAEWILLWHPDSVRYLDNDNALVKDTHIKENHTLWAEFRYKLDECLPHER
jgi:hypothetical protein